MKSSEANTLCRATVSLKSHPLWPILAGPKASFAWANAKYPCAPKRQEMARNREFKITHILGFGGYFRLRCLIEIERGEVFDQELVQLIVEGGHSKLALLDSISLRYAPVRARDGRPSAICDLRKLRKKSWHEKGNRTRRLIPHAVARFLSPGRKPFPRPPLSPPAAVLCTRGRIWIPAFPPASALAGTPRRSSRRDGLSPLARRAREPLESTKWP